MEQQHAAKVEGQTPNGAIEAPEAAPETKKTAAQKKHD